MSKTLDKETLFAYSRWVGSLFGMWWAPIGVALLAAPIMGIINVLLISLIGCLCLLVYTRTQEDTAFVKGLWTSFRDRLSTWWSQRPWKN